MIQLYQNKDQRTIENYINVSPIYKSQIVELSNVCYRSGSDSKEGKEDETSGLPTVAFARAIITPMKMDLKLGVGILQGEETVIVVEHPLISAMRAFDLTVVPGCKRPNKFVADAKSN